MYTDHLISIDEHSRWFERANNDHNARYLIFEFNGYPLGLVNVVQIDTRNSKCYWGFYLGEPDASRVSGAVMEFLALEYIFEELNIRKLYCEVFAFNGAVIKMHKKFGFLEEGRFAQHVLKNGHYEDAVSLALFKKDWLIVKSRLEKICFK